MAIAKTTLLTRLILERNGEWLFLEQTPANGGGFTLVGGRVAVAEFAKEALIRETEEEVGIKIKKKNLTLLHVMHRIMPKNAEIIFFFKAEIWEGEPKSLELEKFSSVKWFLPHALPPKMPQVLGFGLQQILKEKDFSQYPKSVEKSKKEKSKKGEVLEKKSKTTKVVKKKAPPPVSKSQNGKKSVEKKEKLASNFIETISDFFKGN
ncbi:MAG: hypothetical protein RL757_2888 [Bacteroidota bacterium]|jgi:8-oxo-dGTP pyrophosphatase MutT (NUDIX family)